MNASGGKWQFLSKSCKWAPRGQKASCADGLHAANKQVVQTASARPNKQVVQTASVRAESVCGSKNVRAGKKHTDSESAAHIWHNKHNNQLFYKEHLL